MELTTRQFLKLAATSLADLVSGGRISSTAENTLRKAEAYQDRSLFPKDLTIQLIKDSIADLRIRPQELALCDTEDRLTITYIDPDTALPLSEPIQFNMTQTNEIDQSINGINDSDVQFKYNGAYNTGLYAIEEEMIYQSGTGLFEFTDSQTGEIYTQEFTDPLYHKVTVSTAQGHELSFFVEYSMESGLYISPHFYSDGVAGNSYPYESDDTNNRIYRECLNKALQDSVFTSSIQSFVAEIRRQTNQ